MVTVVTRPQLAVTVPMLLWEERVVLFLHLMQTLKRWSKESNMCIIVKYCQLFGSRKGQDLLLLIMKGPYVFGIDLYNSINFNANI